MTSVVVDASLAVNGCSKLPRFRYAVWLTVAWSTVMPVYVAWTVWAWVNHRDGVARTVLFIYLVLARRAAGQQLSQPRPSARTVQPAD
jgi:hypothetical protein